MTGVDNLLRGRPPVPASTLVAGRVTRSDASGVWCTPDGGDERHPLGPCQGARWRPASNCPATAHTHPVAALPAGTRVLVALTGAGPWVISWEEPP